MNIYATILGALLLATYQSNIFAGEQTKRKPNVLLIMTDQQRRDSIGAYGNPVIKTPNLDLLANTGVRFENCYVASPACMPSRASIITGRYPAAHGVWANGVPLPENEETLAKVLLRNGYATRGVGKFHFQPHFNGTPPLPTMETHPEPYYGFQEFHLGEDNRYGELGLWLEKNHPDYAKKEDSELPHELHQTGWAADKTIGFIERCAKQDQPFFVFCSFVDPHEGYGPPSPYREMYKEEEMPQPLRKADELAGGRFENYPKNVGSSSEWYNRRVAHWRAQYYGEVTFIDAAVGQILKTLDELNLRNNTLVVFTSDHGDMTGDHWLWGKGDFHYTAGYAVPLIMNWPNVLKPKVVDGIVQNVDIFPTITDLIGVENPPGIQGKSQRQVMTTNEKNTGYDFGYIESIFSGGFSPDYLGADGPKGNSQGRSSRATDVLTIRNAKWRFTFYTNGSDGELYDLPKDPNEFENQWNNPEYGKIKAELTAKLLDRVAANRDPLPLRTFPY